MGEKLKNFIVGAALFGVLYHAYLLGKRLFPRVGGAAATAAGLALFSALESIGLTGWYYFGGHIDDTSTAWTLIAVMAICQFILFVLRGSDDARRTTNVPTTHDPWSPRRIIIACAICVLSIGSAAFVLVGAWNAATTDSIRTPWPLLPHGTLLAIAVGWLAVFLSTRFVRSAAIAAWQTGITLFSTTAIAPLVYKLGFGFDGFLHIAGEKQILVTGTLNPKPLYYIGQYVFTTWISRATELPIEQVDRWLVPVAAAILIPLAIYLAMDRLSEGARRAPLHVTCYSLLVLFLIPLSPFVATTPQSFAYLLGLAAILLAVGQAQRPAPTGIIAPLILAAWSVAVHPLAGVPFLFVVMALLLVQSDAAHDARRPTPDALCTILSWLFIIASAAAVPLLFYVLSAKGGAQINWNLATLFTVEPWRNFLTSILPWIGNKYVVWPAWASLVLQSLPALVMLGAIGTIMIECRDARRPTPDVLLFASGLLLLISGALLKSAGDFAFLIDYERGNYAERLMVLATLMLAVAAMPFVAWLFDRARSRSPFLLVAFVAGCLAIAAAQTFNALPRNDALVTGHGWSVGSNDVEAVRSIDKDADSNAYTVLADQSVSAAAVSQFGFKRYNGDVFFYPIPTGGELYQLYLDMTYKEPSRGVASDAGKLGGSDLVYVVLNDYWWNADALAESLSSIANREWSFGEWDTQHPGTGVKVYAFDLKTPIKRSTQTSGS